MTRTDATCIGIKTGEYVLLAVTKCKLLHRRSARRMSIALGIACMLHSVFGKCKGLHTIKE